MILAIDPGNIESAFVVIDENYNIIDFGKEDNVSLNEIIETYDCKHLVIEMVASYGMAVGESVFETVFWIGRFYEIALLNNNIAYIERMKRKDVKMNLCQSMRAKDGNITQALIDRFAPNTPNKGKGSKKEPGFFYGFKADIWQAYALAVTYLDWLKGVE